MTKENLKKTLAKIVSHKYNFDLFKEFFKHDFAGMSDDECVNWLVEEIYSDKLLDGLNNRLAPVPVCDLICFGIDTGTRYVLYLEKKDNDEITIMPKLWPKPMVRIGKYVPDNFDVYGDFCYDYGPAFYIDADGDLKYVYEYELTYAVGGLDLTDCPKAVYRQIRDDIDVEVWMNEIYDLLPDWLDTWWDN